MSCDRYKQDLTALASGELSAAAASEVKRHIDQCPTCAAEYADIISIAESARQAGLEPMPKETENAIMAAVCQHISPARTKPRISFRATWALGFATVALLAVASVLVPWRQDQAVEILRRAEAATTQCQSWHIVYKFTSHNRQGQVWVTNEESWYRGPDKLRTENMDSVSRQKNIHITSGDETISYSELTNVANITPLTDEEKRSIGTLGPAISVDLKKDLFSSKAKPRLNGTTKVAGRLCDVVEGEYNSPGRSVKIAYAVDRQNGLVMRKTVVSDGKLISAQEVVLAELDQPIADSVFEFAPRKGATIIKGIAWGWDRKLPYNLPDPHYAAAKVIALTGDGRLGELVSATGPLSVPSYIPTGYRFVEAYSVGAKPGNKARAIEIDYLQPSTGDTIVVREGIDATPDEGRVVSDGDFSGRITNKKISYDYSVLTWQSGKAHFTLTATGIDEAEMVKIAESMTHVSNPGIPDSPAARNWPTQYATVSVQKRSAINTPQVKEPALTMITKLFVKPGKSRQENTFADRRDLDIWRHDKGVRWILDQRTKTGDEVRFRAGSPTPPRSWAAEFCRNPGVLYLGTEKIIGYDCQKYQTTSEVPGFDKKPVKMVRTVWVSTVLNMVLKDITVWPFGTMETDYTSVKIGPQPDSLFELPKGYKVDAGRRQR